MSNRTTRRDLLALAGGSLYVVLAEDLYSIPADRIQGRESSAPWPAAIRSTRDDAVPRAAGKVFWGRSDATSTKFWVYSGLSFLAINHNLA
jgi:hypothetical protein